MKTHFAFALSTLLAMIAGEGSALATIVDPVNDFLPTYAFTKNADLDVVSADVTFNQGAGTFTFEGTMNGAVGTTSTGAYVFGLDRGQGTAGLAAIASNVLFDSVLLLNANGSGAFVDIAQGGASVALPGGSVHISGNTISATFSASLIPSLGVRAPDQYTWNLWPRFAPNVADDTYVSDFAPNNSNAPVRSVPEPATAYLLALGLGSILLAFRRSR